MVFIFLVKSLLYHRLKFITYEITFAVSVGIYYLSQYSLFICSKMADHKDVKGRP